MSKLYRIGQITLLGTTYDVAKNDRFCLVQAETRDAYDRPYSTVVRLEDANRSAAFVQALLDVLGETMVALRSSRDMKRSSAAEQ